MAKDENRGRNRRRPGFMEPLNEEKRSMP